MYKLKEKKLREGERTQRVRINRARQNLEKNKAKK